MSLSNYEIGILQSLFDFNRIPIWIFDKETILFSFFPKEHESAKEKIVPYIYKIRTEFNHPDFDILSFQNELYYIFSFEKELNKYYCLGGPILLHNIRPLSIDTLSFSIYLESEEALSLLRSLPVISLYSFDLYMRLMFSVLRGSSPSVEEMASFQLKQIERLLPKHLSNDLFINKEEESLHTSYKEEIALLSCVREGNLNRLESTYKSLPQVKYGNMSKSPLRLLLYGGIANTTLVTRYAIEGGMDEELAFTLSDIYIRQMENCRTIYELNALNEKMVIDFTTKVHQAKKENEPCFTEPVSKCIHYISNHVYQKITLLELANESHLSPKYLSTLFKTETGRTISAYISEFRIEEAKKLLLYSTDSYSQISNILSFHSHSYFISVFKKHVGLTPKEFRKKYAEKVWTI